MQTKKGFVLVLLPSSQPWLHFCFCCSPKRREVLLRLHLPQYRTLCPADADWEERKGAHGGVAGKGGDLLQSLEFRKSLIVRLKRKKEKLEFCHA